MPYAVVFAPEADAQLEALYHYIASQAWPSTAERYTSAIVDTCEGLSLFPKRGVARDDIRPGLQVTHHKGRTVIAYAVDEVAQQVQVLGVFYGGQDFAVALGPEVDD